MSVEPMYAPDPVGTYSDRLDRLKKRWLGTFSTHLQCNCGKAVISDHATEAASDPNAHLQPYFNIPRSSSPGPYWLLRNFKPHHGYWCDACGAMYKAEVIEKVRCYIPLELTAAEEALREEAAEF